MASLLLAFAVSRILGQGTYLGGRVVVRPVLYLAADAPIPTEVQRQRLVRYLKIAQSRYFELLEGMDTFELELTCQVFRSSADAKSLKLKPNGAAEFVVNELLRHDHKTRWSCPYVYVAVFVGTGSFPGGGGRPINGGHNKGGGIIILSAKDLDDSPNFESTLQHELGHAFGLPHVDVYGYDMLANPSLMSYNPSHHTDFFQVSSTPGRLIPEDLRGLNENKAAFPRFQFDASRILTGGYVLKPDVQLGPMDL